MGGSLRRALVPALAVLALIGVVAVAATGSIPGGSNRTRTPPDVLFDTIFSFFALALVPAAILLVYGLSQRRAVAEEYAKRKRWLSNWALVLILLLVPVIVYLHGPPKLRPITTNGPSAGNGAPSNATTPSATGNGRQYEAQFAWLPVLVILLLAGAAGGAWYLSSRQKPRREPDDAVTETLASVLDDTLDDLRAEADPRRAVIAAYARVERALAAHGIPRRTSETPEELFARTLGRLDVSAASIRRLTDLFERAKFSQHELDVEMKEEAISALEEVRDELRAADARGSEKSVDVVRPIEGRT